MRIAHRSKFIIRSVVKTRLRSSQVSIFEESQGEEHRNPGEQNGVNARAEDVIKSDGTIHCDSRFHIEVVQDRQERADQTREEPDNRHIRNSVGRDDHRNDMSQNVDREADRQVREQRKTSRDRNRDGGQNDRFEIRKEETWNYAADVFPTFDSSRKILSRFASVINELIRNGIEEEDAEDKEQCGDGDHNAKVFTKDKLLTPNRFCQDHQRSLTFDLVGNRGTSSPNGKENAREFNERQALRNDDLDVFAKSVVRKEREDEQTEETDQCKDQEQRLQQRFFRRYPRDRAASGKKNTHQPNQDDEE